MIMELSLNRLSQMPIGKPRPSLVSYYWKHLCTHNTSRYTTNRMSALRQLGFAPNLSLVISNRSTERRDLTQPAGSMDVDI